MEKLNLLKKQDLIGDILDLYDYVETLERENESLKKERNAEPRRSKKESNNYIDDIMLKKGREQVLNYVTSNWYTVDCKFNEDTEKYDYTPYQKWLEKKLSRERMPKDISFNDFTNYFKNELLDMYMKERKEALKEAKED